MDNLECFDTNSQQIVGNAKVFFSLEFCYCSK